MKHNPSSRPGNAATVPPAPASGPGSGRGGPALLAAASPSPRSRLAGLVARHPVTSFLLVALPSSLALMSVPVLAQYELIGGKGLPGAVGLDMEEMASVLLVTCIFLTALAVTAIEGGQAAVRALVRRMTRWHVPVRWWLVAVPAIPVGTVALALVLGDTVTVPNLSTAGREAVALLIALVVINVWEEAVWSGFMQTRLERGHSLFTAAAVTAVPFAAVHMPLRLITGEARTVGELLISFAVLLIFMLVVRSLFGIVLRGARNSILVVAATHTMFNRSNNADGLAADILHGPNRQNAALLATVLLTVVLAVLVRRRLTRSYRGLLDERELTTARPAGTAQVADRR